MVCQTKPMHQHHLALIYDMGNLVLRQQMVVETSHYVTHQQPLLLMVLGLMQEHYMMHILIGRSEGQIAPVQKPNMLLMFQMLLFAHLHIQQMGVQTLELLGLVVFELLFQTRHYIQRQHYHQGQQMQSELYQFLVPYLVTTAYLDCKMVGQELLYVGLNMEYQGTLQASLQCLICNANP